MSIEVTMAIIALTVLLAEGLIEITKSIIAKFLDKDKKYLSSDQNMMLRNLYDLHARYDLDGTPLWYVPRSWAETQKEIAENLRVVSENQKITLTIIERLDRRTGI